ncbi:MAG TPA: HAD family phosphatase [Solirubrobacteraceae bacterium]|nr:HAD family phosphatase [Solirubrobacteraceae bacterium]
MSGRADVEAVVFDLDGVLIDSEPAWDRARREVVEEAGGHWGQDATREMMGMSSPEWSRYLAEELGVALEPGEINERVLARLLASYERELPLLPGALAAVRRIAAVWPVGLASSANRPAIDAVLSLSGVAGCFRATVSAEEVARGKPAPDVYLAAAGKLGVDPGRAVAVEDSSNGLRAAAAAGMVVVAVPNREFPPGREALSLADLTIASLDELTPDSIRGIALAESGRVGDQPRAGEGPIRT